MNDRLEIASRIMTVIINDLIQHQYQWDIKDVVKDALNYTDALIAAAGEQKPTDYVDKNYMKVTCPHCNGHGVMEDKSSTSGWKLCPRCNGTKIVYTELIAEYEQPKPSVPSVEEMILMLEKKGLSLERNGRNIYYQHYIRSIKAIHQWLTERTAK